ncbi:U1 snRNP component [Plasmopara halstedii]|uniref:U1 snRNP component n=1 Tax=Plasmopara halstedii TaxID=4781 RepID=A0A0N7L3P1_PLAHL|nr:U1 snRNP component [Plasmopara halstedii]CEG36419.1 U1 snRNP component [Plasmopara halstedii]|eukprot:XP_024572788.1 U1 snRNP component [Plasmopara halstedii]
MEIKTTAVLSLNGQAQVTLSVDINGDVEQKQSANSPALIGEATLELMKLLGSLVRLRISDGRVIIGRFHCFDKHQNVILRDAREFAPTYTGVGKNSKEKTIVRDAEEDARFAGDMVPPNSRALGMALVPGKHIVYMKVQS